MGYMKKKIVIIAVVAAIAVVGIVGGVLCKKAFDARSAQKRIGKVCSEYGIAESDIYLIGKDTFVTKEEVELAKNLYILAQNLSEEEADEVAVEETVVDALKIEKAMYNAAIQNGYSVEEEEFEKSFTDFKFSFVASSDSEVLEILEKSIEEVFESEDEYWDYQKTKYEKQFIIGKYMDQLEWDYLKEKAEKGEDDEADWDAEYKRIQDETVMKQEFVKL